MEAIGASATRRGRRGTGFYVTTLSALNELSDPTLREVTGPERRRERAGNRRPNGRRNERRLIPSGSIASKWKHGDARVEQGGLHLALETKRGDWS